jgi:hypothetical protein
VLELHPYALPALPALFVLPVQAASTPYARWVDRETVPRPRPHLIRFHGVLAPNAKLHALVVPQGPPDREEPATEADSAAECEVETAQVRPHRISWARLLKRVFDIDMQHCPNCGAGELKIIAAIVERPGIEKILTYLGLDPQPPLRGRAREAGQDFAA